MIQQWTDDLIIDHGEIDRDHKFLFQLSIRIQEADQLGMPKDEIARLLTECVNFMAIHFSHEEELMRRLHYPEMINHVNGHDSFFDRLGDYLAAFERDEVGIRRRLSAFVGTYAWNHIQTYDRALADWCRERTTEAA